MRISQLSLGGHGAWPDLHLAELSGELNLFCAGPCGGKSTLARLIGHLLYGKTGSPWRQPFGQSASTAEGTVTLQSAAGTFVLRRRRESGNSSTLTIAAADGAAVNGQTVQALLGDLSPRLAAQLFAVDFAESPQIEWLLSDPFARDLFVREVTANLRADEPLERAEQCLDRQVARCRQTLADLQTRAVAWQTKLAVLGHEIGHVANGDMVTLTLIQGVVNTFVHRDFRQVVERVPRVAPPRVSNAHT
ncbi:MAG: M48 family metalloprotease, partial [Planctomycetes bacterium]|nr:M48 family metalloprotease [Planctomycetota bacterium]